MGNLTRDDRTDEQREADRCAGIVVFDGISMPQYLQSYGAATRILADGAWASGGLEAVAYPLFFLQRHTLELCLKEVVSVLQVIEREKEEVGAATHAEWREVVARQEQEHEAEAKRQKQLPRRHEDSRLTHRVDALLARAVAHLSSTDHGPLPPEFGRLVDLVTEFEADAVERSRYDQVLVNGKLARSLPRVLGPCVSVPLGRMQELLQEVLEHMSIDHVLEKDGFFDGILRSHMSLLEQLHELDRV